ncbi:hypothetical protein K505DRAFT_358369 [Melanomma pulvis-pyrius CBS 109.77]|uniref:Cytochrome b561 domain-containing protein n=1 Tax=Melanomma pulvis-pyrius CBS 109.77 TaxID=1314802 RepID=A0A6A6XMD4_9PLEO|nr:hypothetical protein K505DRAFT_358369 [Melanomma pulvis-pyrius CBS 109.77]
MDFSKLDPEALMALVARMTKVRTAHGVIMPLAIVVWFPLGVFLLRLLNMKNKVLWHTVWQSFGLVLLVTGFGLGRWLSNKAGRSSEGHTILGTVITLLFILMPIIGWLHHRHRVAKGSQDFKRHIHVWGGRLLLLLGFINGITGLRLSKNKNSAYIAYGVVAGLFGVAYAGVWYLKVVKAKTKIEETELEQTAQHK